MDAVESLAYGVEPVLPAAADMARWRRPVVA